VLKHVSSSNIWAAGRHFTRTIVLLFLGGKLFGTRKNEYSTYKGPLMGWLFFFSHPKNHTYIHALRKQVMRFDEYLSLSWATYSLIPLKSLLLLRKVTLKLNRKWLSNILTVWKRERGRDYSTLYLPHMDWYPHGLANHPQNIVSAGEISKTIYLTKPVTIYRNHKPASEDKSLWTCFVEHIFYCIIILRSRVFHIFWASKTL
jgi:hypothetical protein